MPGAVRGGMRQEEVAGPGRGTRDAQIGEQRFPHILRQRQQAFSVRLTGTDEETPVDPVHIGQWQAGDFFRPQAES